MMFTGSTQPQRTTERIYEAGRYRIEYVHTQIEILNAHTHSINEYRYARGVWLLCKDGFHAFSSKREAMDHGQKMALWAQGGKGERAKYERN